MSFCEEAKEGKQNQCRYDLGNKRQVANLKIFMALYVFQCLRYFFVSRVATKKQHGGHPWRVDIANTKYVEAGHDSLPLLKNVVSTGLACIEKFV